eukprot:6570755-Pyramimonas_sp.AAC.1
MSTRMCEHLLYLQRRLRRALGRLGAEHAALAACRGTLAALEGTSEGGLPEQRPTRRWLWRQKVAADASGQVAAEAALLLEAVAE